MGGRIAGLVLLGALAGCGRTPGPPDTGARQTVLDFYQALVRHDWPAAYAAVHPDSRARCDAAEFARRAEDYCRGLGFVPREVRVRSCEEQEARAVAHVVIRGPAGSRPYRDAVTLRRRGDGWGVVLPDQFGQAAGLQP